MWLRFTTIQGTKASVQISKRDYAQLLERFSVEGATKEEEVECPFCVKSGMDCDICPLGNIEKDKSEYYLPCIGVVPGLNDACNALDDLYMDQYSSKKRHKNNVRALRNFRRGIMRAARSNNTGSK